MSTNYLDDEFLIQYFLDNYKKAIFLKRKAFTNDIKERLKELLANEKKIKETTSKATWKGFIPKSQQIKIEIIHELWELMLKEAMYCLRDQDPEDPNEFRQDFGIIDVKKYFEKFSEFEEVLYGTNRYYRDHSLHVIRVFFLGFYLLTSLLTEKNELQINFESIRIFHSELVNDLTISIEEKQAIWTIIALTHDLGYPIEKIDEINDKITGLIQYYGPSGIEEFKYRLPLQNQFLNDFVLKFISSKLTQKEVKEEYYTVIQNKYYLKFAKAFENFSHGIMSCILLMKHLVYFKESDYSHSRLNSLNNRDAIQFLIRRSILRSIASHDNQDIYHVHPNNFLFMLAFCDDLQEWDRPRITQRFQPSDNIIVKSFNSNIISFEKHLNFPEKSPFSEDDIKNYARSIKKYIKLFRSGPVSEK
ncbi:hypothetical protein LCGC14_2160210, partial [marine sediment metagenome]